jgi:hypothetical protein
MPEWLVILEGVLGVLDSLAPEANSLLQSIEGTHPAAAPAAALVNKLATAREGVAGAIANAKAAAN